MPFRLFSWLALLFSLTSPVKAQTGPPLISGIVDQRDYPDSINGCGPASILNVLKFSGEEYQRVYVGLLGQSEGIKMRFIVDRYFKNRPSVTYPGEKRWRVHGIQNADLVAGMNELLAEHKLGELNATYLDIKEGETQRNHIVRCHDLISASLRSGVKPILSVRSFVVRQREENNFEPGWEAGFQHNVVVSSVTRAPTENGFELAVMDPYRGKKTTIFIHREGNGQAFRALKGIEGSGSWLSGTPFLQIIAPDLPTVRPRDIKWSERYILIANFLVGEF